MSNNSTLQQLCQRLIDNQFDTIHDAEQALEQFELMATPGAVLGLINDIDEARNGMTYTPIMRLKSRLEHLEAENKGMRSEVERASYWKQRAKSAEGHLFSSDFRAAAQMLHKHTRYSSTPWSELTEAQQIQIEIAAGMTIAAVNERRDARKPGDDAGVVNG